MVHSIRPDVALDDSLADIPAKPVPPREIAEQLAAPFAPEDVEYKPGPISGNHALALAYIDARCVQNRLDEVLGIDGWQSEFHVLPGGCVQCKLSLRIGEVWFAKSDVGGPSEQKDPGDRMKAAFSDALKRAAVQWSVGRYLYGLTPEWRDWDPATKRFVNGAYLSKQQWAEIDALLKTTNTRLDRFLAWCGARTQDSIPASRFQEAVNFLHKKEKNGHS